MTTAGAIDLGDARFQRAVERLHRRGPRALCELLLELAGDRLLMTEIEALVSRYAALDRQVLAAVDGDKFPPNGDEP